MVTAEMKQLAVVAGREEESVSVWPTPGWPVVSQSLSESHPGTTDVKPGLSAARVPVGSGPQTRSHVRPSVPPAHGAKPCPAQHNTARRDSEQGRRHNGDF